MTAAPLAVTEAVAARLQTITTANGYYTDLGNEVERTWPMYLLIHQQRDLPIITLHPASDSTSDSRGGAHRASRELVIDAVFSPLETSIDVPDQWLADVRDALAEIHDDEGAIRDVQLGVVEWKPLDSETQVIQWVCPITVDYTQ